MSTPASCTSGAAAGRCTVYAFGAPPRRAVEPPSRRGAALAAASSARSAAFSAMTFWCADVASALRPRDRSDLADRFGVLQVRVDRRDDDARFDGDQVDADQRDAHPGVDDDALVQDAIQNVDETCAACCSFNCHSAAPGVRRRRRDLTAARCARRCRGQARPPCARAAGSAPAAPRSPRAALRWAPGDKSRS